MSKIKLNFSKVNESLNKMDAMLKNWENVSALYTEDQFYFKQWKNGKLNEYRLIKINGDKALCRPVSTMGLYVEKELNEVFEARKNHINGIEWMRKYYPSMVV